MKRKVKSYLAFTSLPYRIVVYLLMSAGAAGIGFWAASRLGEAGVIVAAVILPMAEILSDNWLFGGIQAKEAGKLDCLKTSGRGMEILKNALVLDLVRKFLTALGTVLVCYLAIWASYRHADDIDAAFSQRGLISGGGWQGAGILLYFIMVSYVISTAGTFFSRYSGMIWVNMVMGYIAVIFGVLSAFLLGLSEVIFIIDMFLALAGILVSMLAVRTAMGKVKGGYYDK